MCCLFAILVLLGPRSAIFIWWLASMERWEAAFSSFWVPFLGFLFLPFTTLMYVVVAPRGTVIGIDWLWLGLAVVADASSHGGGVYGNRDRLTR